jgi:hypothetical protein
MKHMSAPRIPNIIVLWLLVCFWKCANICQRILTLGFFRSAR